MAKDKGILKVEDIEDLMLVETDPKKFSHYVASIQEEEPQIWTWVNTNRMEEVAKLGYSFPSVFDNYPTLPIYLNGLLLSLFYRGYKLAEAKWKPNITEDGVGKPIGNYNPRDEDFI